MRRYLCISVLRSLLGTGIASAHNPGEQLIGSAVRRTFFFCSVVLCLGLVIGSFVEDIPYKILRHVLLYMLGGGMIIGCGYFVYHGFID